MEKPRTCEMEAYSRRWANISLIENISQYQKVNDSRKKTKILKRDKTDFFPNKFELRKKYKERSFFIFSAESCFKIIWDSIKLLLICIEAILIPYMLSFCPNNIRTYQNIINFLDIFFFFDILLKLNTEIYYNGVLFSDRLFILKEYLKSWLFCDILSVIPYNVFFSEARLSDDYLYIPVTDISVIRYIWLLKLLRLLSSKELFYRIEDFLVSTYFLNPLRTLDFFFKIFLWVHWLVCIVYSFYIRALETEPALWTSFHDELSDRYLRYIYLVIETMTSVGYGDMLPKTVNQRIAAAVSMSFACVLFGDIIGNIQVYIENINSDNRYYDQMARRLKTHLKQHHFPPSFRNRVIQYIYYLQSVNQKHDPKEIGIIDQLSYPLREEIYTQTRGYLLAKSPVFNCYSGSFLKYLGNQMKIQVFATGDILFKEGDLSNSIYYLCSGKVQVYHERTKTVFKDIKVNKCFGEISFFLGRSRTASAMCLRFGEFLSLERDSLFNVLNAHPKEKEVTNLTIQNITKYEDYTLLGIRCYLCKKVGHVAKSCREFIIMVDRNDITRKAESRKYMNNKSIRVRNIPDEGSEEKDYKPYYNRYDLTNAKGLPFSPGIKYDKHKKIVNGALSFRKYTSTKQLKFNRFLSFEGSHDSDDYVKRVHSGHSDYSSGTESMTFGNV